VFAYSLLPAIAYILDMYRRTGEFYGVNEALLSSAIAATVFSLLGAQPITIVGYVSLEIYFVITTKDITAHPLIHSKCHRSNLLVQLHNLRHYQTIRRQYLSPIYGLDGDMDCDITLGICRLQRMRLYEIRYGFF